VLVTPADMRDRGQGESQIMPAQVRGNFAQVNRPGGDQSCDELHESAFASGERPDRLVGDLVDVEPDCVFVALDPGVAGSGEAAVEGSDPSSEVGTSRLPSTKPGGTGAGCKLGGVH